jgi:hypothetical protein
MTSTLKEGHATVMLDRDDAQHIVEMLQQAIVKQAENPKDAIVVQLSDDDSVRVSVVGPPTPWPPT